MWKRVVSDSCTSSHRFDGGGGGVTTLKDLSPIVSEIMNLFITWFKPHSLLLPDSLYTVSDNPLRRSAPQVTFISQTTVSSLSNCSLILAVRQRISTFCRITKQLPVLGETHARIARRPRCDSTCGLKLPPLFTHCY